MITNNKLRHILGVAVRCKELAEENGMSEEEQNACFIMGFLHDVGYSNLFGRKDLDGHPEIGYNMVKDFNKHEEALEAIKNHGTAYDNLTVYDKILNTADLEVNYYGECVTFAERLQDIASRHDIYSEHYQMAVRQAEALKNNSDKYK